MSLSPRGYTCFKSVTCANEFVMLQRPPPVTATFANTFFPFSKMQTRAFGICLLAVMAAMKPAAPPPITAILSMFIRAYRSSSMAVLLAYAVLFASKKSVFTMFGSEYCATHFMSSGSF